jgi:hypothetical protein
MGGVFRGEQLDKVRVLIVDRDNPEAIIKKRLRAYPNNPEARKAMRAQAKQEKKNK